MPSTRASDRASRDLRRERFLIPGALWRAIRRADRCVVLLDELDKAPVALDHALLEWLEEFKISDSLLGTIAPVSRPYAAFSRKSYRDNWKSTSAPRWKICGRTICSATGSKP